MIKQPAPSPCNSCPYRSDVPSGIWSREEYDKLPTYDEETGNQPPSVFMCHRQDGRLCAGWVAVHDMAESLGLRVAVSLGAISPEDFEALVDYQTSTPLFLTGVEARKHGLRDLLEPGEQALRAIGKLRHEQ